MILREGIRFDAISVMDGRRASWGGPFQMERQNDRFVFAHSWLGDDVKVVFPKARWIFEKPNGKK